MSPKNQLGELQLAIMQVLWDRGAATVAEVHAALVESRIPALTTIATMLSKMEKKGVVEHHREGRQFVYRPGVAQDHVQRSMVGDLAERLFGGDITALVSHLLSGEIQPDELAELKRLIVAHERQR